MQNNLWPTLKRLFTYSKIHQRRLILAILMLWLVAIAEVTGPIIVGYFIDRILPDKIFPLLTVIGLVVFFLVLQIGSVVLRYYQALFFHHTALCIVKQLRIEVMDVVLHQPLSAFEMQSIGNLMSRLTNDTEVVKDLYVTVVISVLRSTALISTTLVAMFLLDWHLACIALILFPIIIGVMYLYQHYSIPIFRKMRAYLADINDGFNEAINGMGVIQQFRQQDRFGNKLKRVSHDHFETRMATLKIEGYLLRPLLSLLFALVLCGILFLFGLSSFGTIGVGVLYAFINYLSRLNEPLIELISQLSIMQQAVVAGERIFELMDSPRQRYGKDDTPLNSGSIELRNLYFSYPKGATVLRNISLTAPAKSFIALVGHTGSGKSTLASLIMGYYPVSAGVLLLDGRPIETLSHRVLSQGVAIVQQDPIVMVDTVYGNIALGRKISEQQVWHALEQVKLDTLVRSFSGGVFTELGEKGNTLSVGQKQLLALARVLVSAPVLLILDEATANIDSGTEQAISNALEILRRHTTLLVIAHRLSTIVEADQIFVLHRGEAVEQGTHTDLMQSKGRYYQMYQLQQKGRVLFEHSEVFSN